MGLKDDLITEVGRIFRSTWTERDGTVVPDDTDVQLGNDAVKLTSTVLYADLADSTALVDNHTPSFAAEMYKAFLLCAARIIRSEGGEITAYDGDRIMAVYLGDSKNTTAVRSALKINYAARNIIQPARAAQYPNSDFQLRHVVGVDTSDLYVARTGIRGANDLVWVGRAANYAAKLAALPHRYGTYITAEVHESAHVSVKMSNGRSIWEGVRWDSFDDRTIYRSDWWWSIA